MKNFISYYYLLFVLLIMGTFASMAQNDYGNIILGCVAFAFAFLFAIQFMATFSTDKQVNYLNQSELFALTLIATILGLRVFYIHFQWVEIIYGLAGLTLIGIQFRKMLIQWQSNKNRNKMVAFLTIAFRLSIIFYLLSMTLVPFAPEFTEPAGEIAFALLLLFLILAYVKGDLIMKGEKISPVQLVNQLKDHALVLLVLFALFTSYMGLTKIGAAPTMYSDELPQAYFELVKQSEAGKIEKGETSQTEKFKEMYDGFVKKNQTLEGK